MSEESNYPVRKLTSPDWLIDGTKERHPREVNMKKVVRMNPRLISTGDESRLRLPKESREALGWVFTGFFSIITVTTLVIAILL